MEKLFEKNTTASTLCSSENKKIGRDILTTIGDKWSFIVIITLDYMPNSRCRFSELQKSINGISQRVLTDTLRNLEKDGVLKRYVFPEIPPRVEYELTELGKGLLKSMEPFLHWIKSHEDEIKDNREKFDLSNK